MKYWIEKEEINKGKVEIRYDFSFSSNIQERAESYKDSSSLVFGNSFNENETLERNMMFYLAIFENFTKKEVNDAEKEKEFLDAFVCFALKTNIHEIAYIIDKVFMINNDNDYYEKVNLPQILVSKHDVELVLTINDDISSVIYDFTRWVEKKIFYALRLIVEENSWDLNDASQLKFEREKRETDSMKYSLNSITHYYERPNGDKICRNQSNSRIIKSLTLSQKITLFNNAKYSNSYFDKMNLLLDHSAEPGTFDENDKEQLLNFFKNITNWRNAISHHEFIINRKSISSFGDILNNFKKYGHLISNSKDERYKELITKLRNAIEKNTGSMTDENREKIRKHFREYFKDSVI